MNKTKRSYYFLPAFLIGIIEGLIVTLALFCFLLAKSISQQHIYIYTGIAVFFIAVLLALGAYYTRKEELDSTDGKSKILKIYQALDIDEKLKEAMVNDSVQENQIWEKEWQEGDNATNHLTPQHYAFSMLGGFISGGLIIMLNHYFFQLPDYAALFIPFVLLAFLGFYKYKLSNQKPLNGLLLISLSGIATALAAYYAGSFF